jgi:hypothetical protein
MQTTDLWRDKLCTLVNVTYIVSLSMLTPLVIFIIPTVAIIARWSTWLFVLAEVTTIVVITAVDMVLAFLGGDYCQEGQEEQGVYCSERQGSACG